MKIKYLHDWQLDARDAVGLQKRLAALVSREGRPSAVRYVAGMDMAAGKRYGVATAAVVVLQYPELKPVETQVVSSELRFPYVPGLLSFREAPLMLAACERLATIPDLIMIDGQGIAHPRRLGLASHIGLFLDVPAIGCAKSLLVGKHGALDTERGSCAEITDTGEVIGAALRTRTGVRPVYVSPGHKISLEPAIHWVLECSRGYRLPEPTRLAHLAAGLGTSLPDIENLNQRKRNRTNAGIKR